MERVEWIAAAYLPAEQNHGGSLFLWKRAASRIDFEELCGTVSHRNFGSNQGRRASWSS
jgi:hypothetical protein